MATAGHRRSVAARLGRQLVAVRSAACAEILGRVVSLVLISAGRLIFVH